MSPDDSLVPRRPDALADGCGTTTGEVVTIAAFGGRRTPMPDPALQRARAVWTAGDLARIAAGWTHAAGEFVDRLHLSQGEATLDVSCGTRSVALHAARAGASVVGLAPAPSGGAAERTPAEGEGLRLRFDDGDVEALPYADASFATVTSMFGTMFTPRHERAIAELFRVVRPGGRIALASWTSRGFVGELLRAHAAVVPPDVDVATVLGWGDPQAMRVRLLPHAQRVRGLAFAERAVELRYPLSPAAVVELYRECYGPLVRAFAMLAAPQRALLAADLLDLWLHHNVGTSDVTRVEATYLEVRIELA